MWRYCPSCNKYFEAERGPGRPRRFCYTCKPPKQKRPRREYTEAEQRSKLMRKLRRLLISRRRKLAYAEYLESTSIENKIQAQEKLAKDPRSICGCGRDYLSLPLRHECINPLPNPSVRDHDRYRFLF